MAKKKVSTEGELDVARLRLALVRWFEKNARELPWRGAPAPYEVWVSEIMLQQTRANVVAGYFVRFLAELPTLEALAAAELEDVYRLWQGLGYYSRARRLHEGARYVVRQLSGVVPRSVEELLAIPGIGRYTAGAIASQAYGVRAPIVDGNVQRVLSRLLALEGDPTKAANSAKIWELSGRFVEALDPRVVNPALMELGALVCTPKKPTCSECPWNVACLGFSSGEPERFPELPKRALATKVTAFVFVLEHRRSYLVEKAKSDGRWWKGLSLLPLVELGEASEGAIAASSRVLASFAKTPKGPVDTVAARKRHASAIVAGAGLELSSELELSESFGHSVTRYSLELIPVFGSLGGRRPKAPDGAEWVKAADLAELSWPGPLGRLVRRLTES